MAEQAQNLPAAFDDTRIGNGYGHQPVWNSAIHHISARPPPPINLERKIEEQEVAEENQP